MTKLDDRIEEFLALTKKCKSLLEPSLVYSAENIIRDLQAENKRLREALGSAHSAIEALLRAQMNPHIDRLSNVADNKIGVARRHRAALKEDGNGGV